MMLVLQIVELLEQQGKNFGTKKFIFFPPNWKFSHYLDEIGTEHVLQPMNVVEKEVKHLDLVPQGNIFIRGTFIYFIEGNSFKEMFH